MIHGLVVTILMLLAACKRPQTGAKPPGDRDSLLAGTYALAIHKRSFLSGDAAATGSLVLFDSALPSRAHYWGLRPMNGCLTLRGDLRVLSIPGATPESFATLTQWSRDTTGSLKVPAFTGVDYGYWVTFVLQRSAMRGTGSYFGVGSLTGTNSTRWRAKRIGPPDPQMCSQAFYADSIWAVQELRPN